MKRYTGKSLEKDVEGFNAQLGAIGDTYRFSVQYRYGYAAVELATPEQLAHHCHQRNLEIGSPRECLAACNRYLASAALNALARKGAA